MTCHKDFFLDHPADVWIETGTYLGDGIEKAIRAGYTKIVSIELSDHYYDISKARYESNEAVHILHGRSYEILPQVLNASNVAGKKIVFWLDAHYSMCGTAGIDDPNPLLKELKVIRHWVEESKTKLLPTIIVDDLRTFGKNISGFDTGDIVESIKSISSEYAFSFCHGYNGAQPTDPTHVEFKNDILIARH